MSKLFFMNHILVANDVTKQFGSNYALKNVSLEIPANSIYGLLGPNGAGKTTLIRIINQITYPDTGSVIFDGEPLKPSHVSMIGYLPEERGLYKSMKVGEQALYLAMLKGLSKAEAKKRLKYWFENLAKVFMSLSFLTPTSTLFTPPSPFPCFCLYISPGRRSST